MKKTHKTRYTKQKMLAYYKEWQESGLGKKAYCQQKGVIACTFAALAEYERETILEKPKLDSYWPKLRVSMLADLLKLMKKSILK